MTADATRRTPPPPVGRATFPPGCDPRRAAGENGADGGRYAARRDWPDIGTSVRLLEGDTSYPRHLAAWAYRYTPWPFGAAPDVVAWVQDWAAAYVAGYLRQVTEYATYLLNNAEHRGERDARMLASRRAAAPSRPLTR